MSNEDLDGEGSLSSNVSFLVVGVGTVMLLVKLKLYVGVLMTLMYGCDVSWSKFCRDGFDRVTVGGEVSFGVEYDDR